MKPLYLLFLAIFCCNGCKETVVLENVVNDVIVVDSCEVLKSELLLNQIEGKWYYKNQPFNGYSLKFHANGVLQERLGFYMGKREGIAKRWSKNGVLRVESNYKQNRLEGSYKSWWENGVLGSQANYVNGKMNGVEKKWYDTGQRSKERQLVDGLEEGMQKAWLENGTLYVNYEAKNGRIFGMRRANSCYQLKDEVVIRSK